MMLTLPGPKLRAKIANIVDLSNDLREYECT